MIKKLMSSHRLPFIIAVTLLILSLWLSMRAVTNYILLMVGQFLEYIPVFVLFGSSIAPSILGLIATSTISIVTWLMSTKIKEFQGLKWRIFIFSQMIVGIVFYYTWFITAPVYNVIVPYLLERIHELEIVNVWHGVLVGDTTNLLILLVFIPGIIMALLLIWLAGQYALHRDDLREAFEEFEYNSRFLQSFFSKGEEEKWPDVVLGPDSETQELIIQPGKDRTLNNIIIGSIGTGKTAALVLPILNQDLHWMSRFINQFRNVYQRDDYHTEEIKGMYLNGISVIEPSNDLCQKTFQLVKAHNIPEDSVFYIDPTNPNTPNINPMQGPVDQVAEAFAMVIEGLGEGGDGGNFFFQQSERNHLKHYIYLLKLHEPDKEVTFDMLLDMYNSSQLVRTMHVKLKDTFPDNYNDIEDRDQRNHWQIVKQIDSWFDNNLLPKTSRNGENEKVTHGVYRGQDVYYDAKAEYVQGLRNILNDIGANKLIRRVLFGESKFNFDKHLEFGGVLLVNTAKGELSGLSNVLGKLILLSLQNAVFRREPNTSNFHHILVDEFPDYVYRPFKEFPAQSRKYKTIVTVVAQTVTQLADKYGETYMHTLLGTLRHKMVYGDIPDYDAQLFSNIFGEEERFEETQGEQTVSPLQEMPMTRAGSQYAKTKEAILTPSDIIFQKEFQAAVKIVKHNRPIPVRQIDANFVPKEEFKEAVVLVDTEAGQIWLDEKEKFLEFDILANESIEDEELLEQQEIATISEDSENVVETPEVDEEITLATHPGQPIHVNEPKPQRRLRKPPLVDNVEEILSSAVNPELASTQETDIPLIEPEKKGIETPQNIEDTTHLSTNHEKEEQQKPEVIVDEYDPLADIFGDSSNVEPKVSKLSEKEEELIKTLQKEVNQVKKESHSDEKTNDQNDLNFLFTDYEDEK
ncbi:type IV secretory system conjugative DNA transfer family protein [Bacillus alkalicellulosilyticus]|uniref:type IV secretory system conjugative DNA transfer family protein n=1 Tax=Alkalihalobacterium alkalicellulosilyticum TaxID=1912214 RepID=UPI00099730F5|nr:type IV secretory system conjugative DNA transfer family protein [Bacillus alkalicellulosilyticus]